MFEGVLERFLLDYFGEFVDFDKEDLHLSVWQGDVLLRNLKLRKGALDALKLPIDVKHGTLSTLRVRVPWSSLGSDPVQVMLDGLRIVAVPLHEEKDGFDREAEARLARRIRRQRLKEMERLQKREGLTAEELEKERTNQSLIERMLAKVIQNVYIVVTGVHIRLEAPSVGRQPFAVGFTLGKATLCTVDETGAQTFVQPDSKEDTLKRLTWQGLAVYWDSSAEEWNKLSAEDCTARLRAGHSGDWVLLPVQAKCHLVLSNDIYLPAPLRKTNGVFRPRVLVRLEVSKFVARTTRVQLRQLTALVERFAAAAVRAEVAATFSSVHYMERRPTCSVGGHCRLWWNHAIHTVMLLNRIRHQRSSHLALRWSSIEAFARKRRRYIALHKRTCTEGGVPFEWLPVLNEEEKKELEALEDEFEVEQLALFRSLARSELHHQLVRLRAFKRSQERQREHERARAQSAGGGGFWGNVVGLLSGEGAEKPIENTARVLMLTPEQRRQIYSAIDFDETLRAARLPPNYVSFRFEFDLCSVELCLLEGTRELARLGAGGSCLWEQRPTSWRVNVVMSRMQIMDTTLKQARPALRARTETGNVLELSVEHNPQAVRAEAWGHFAIAFSLAPLDYLHRARWVQAVVNCVRVTQAYTRPVNWQEERRAQLVSALTEHRLVELQLRVGAPRLLVPAGSKLLAIELGELVVQSRPPASQRHSALVPLDSSLIPDGAECAYDSFEFALSQTRVSLASSFRALQAGQSGLDEIVKPFAVRITVRTLRPSRSPLPLHKLPRVCLSGCLPELTIRLSPIVVQSLRRVFATSSVEVAVPSGVGVQPASFVEPGLPSVSVKASFTLQQCHLHVRSHACELLSAELTHLQLRATHSRMVSTLHVEAKELQITDEQETQPEFKLLALADGSDGRFVVVDIAWLKQSAAASRGVVRDLTVECGRLALQWNPRTVAALNSSFATTTTLASSAAELNTSVLSSSSLPPISPAPAVSFHGPTRLQAHLQSFDLTFNTVERRRLARMHAQAGRVIRRIDGHGHYEVSAVLGSLTVDCLAHASPHHSRLIGMSEAGAQAPMFELWLTDCPSAFQQPSSLACVPLPVPGSTSAVAIHAEGVRLVYIQNIVFDLLEYCTDTFASHFAQEDQPTVEAMPSVAVAGATFVSVHASLRNVVVVLPRTVHSTQGLAATVESITVRSRPSVLQAELTAFATQASATALVDGMLGRTNANTHNSEVGKQFAACLRYPRELSQRVTVFEAEIATVVLETNDNLADPTTAFVLVRTPTAHVTVLAARCEEPLERGDVKEEKAASVSQVPWLDVWVLVWMPQEVNATINQRMWGHIYAVIQDNFVTGGTPLPTASAAHTDAAEDFFALRWLLSLGGVSLTFHDLRDVDVPLPLACLRLRRLEYYSEFFADGTCTLLVNPASAWVQGISQLTLESFSLLDLRAERLPPFSQMLCPLDELLLPHALCPYSAPSLRVTWIDSVHKTPQKGSVQNLRMLIHVQRACGFLLLDFWAHAWGWLDAAMNSGNVEPAVPPLASWLFRLEVDFEDWNMVLPDLTSVAPPHVDVWDCATFVTRCNLRVVYVSSPLLSPLLCVAPVESSQWSPAPEVPERLGVRPHQRRDPLPSQFAPALLDLGQAIFKMSVDHLEVFLCTARLLLTLNEGAPAAWNQPVPPFPRDAVYSHSPFNRVSCAIECQWQDLASLRAEDSLLCLCLNRQSGWTITPSCALELHLSHAEATQLGGALVTLTQRWTAGASKWACAEVSQDTANTNMAALPDGQNRSAQIETIATSVVKARDVQLSGLLVDATEGRYIPLLRCRSKLSAEYKSVETIRTDGAVQTLAQTQCGGRLATSVDVHVFAAATVSWEPLLEETALVVDWAARDAGAADARQVDVAVNLAPNGAGLNVNISTRLLYTLSAFLQRTAASPDKPLDSQLVQFSPYLLRNCTGAAVQFEWDTRTLFALSADRSKRLRATPQVVEAGDEIAVAFPSLSDHTLCSALEMWARPKSAMLSLSVQLAGGQQEVSFWRPSQRPEEGFRSLYAWEWGQLTRVVISLPSTAPYPLQRRVRQVHKNAPRLECFSRPCFLYVDVEVLQGRKVITLRSCTQIVNTLPFDLAVRFTARPHTALPSDESVFSYQLMPHCLTAPLRADRGVCVPLNAMHLDAVSLCVAQARQQLGWSSSLSLAAGGNVVQCKGLLAAGRQHVHRPCALHIATSVTVNAAKMGNKQSLEFRCVSGVITLSAEERAQGESGRIGTVQRCLLVQAPFRLDNLFPQALHFFLDDRSLRESPNAAGVPCALCDTSCALLGGSGVLGPSQRIHLLGSLDVKSRALCFTLRGFHSSPQIRLDTRTPQTREVLLQDDVGRILTAWVRTTRTDSVGGIAVTVGARFWLINRTTLPIVFRRCSSELLGRAPPAEEAVQFVAGQTQKGTCYTHLASRVQEGIPLPGLKGEWKWSGEWREQKERGVERSRQKCSDRHPILPLGSKLTRGDRRRVAEPTCVAVCLHDRSEHSKWSHVLRVDGLDFERRLTFYTQTHEHARRCDIALLFQRAPPPFVWTRCLSILPRFVLANQCRCAVLVRQAGVECPRGVTLLRPCEAKPLYWQLPPRTRGGTESAFTYQLAVSFACDRQWEWSMPFPLNRLVDGAVVLPVCQSSQGKAEGAAVRLLRVTRAGSHNCILTLCEGEEEEEKANVRLINWTPFILEFFQPLPSKLILPMPGRLPPRSLALQLAAGDTLQCECKDQFITARALSSNPTVFALNAQESSAFTWPVPVAKAAIPRLLLRLRGTELQEPAGAHTRKHARLWKRWLCLSLEGPFPLCSQWKVVDPAAQRTGEAVCAVYQEGGTTVVCVGPSRRVLHLVRTQCERIPTEESRVTSRLGHEAKQHAFINFIVTLKRVGVSLIHNVDGAPLLPSPTCKPPAAINGGGDSSKQGRVNAVCAVPVETAQNETQGVARLEETRAREIAFLTLDSLTVKWCQDRLNRKLTVKAGGVQVDNQERGVVWPVLMAPLKASKSKKKTTPHVPPFVSFAFSQRLRTNRVETLSLDVQAFKLQLTRSFIAHLDKFTTSVRVLLEHTHPTTGIYRTPFNAPSHAEAVSDASEWMPSERCLLKQLDLYTPTESLQTVLTQALRQTQARYVQQRVERAHLGAIRCLFSFVGAKANQGDVDTVSAENVLQRLMFGLTEVERTSLCVSAANWKDLGSVSEALERVSEHSKTELWMQVYKFAFSIGLLGNPSHLVSSVGLGLHDLLVAPASALAAGELGRAGVGVVKGVRSLVQHTVHGVGETVSSITRNVGGVTAALSGDTSYQDKRATQRKHGLVAGGSRLVEGVWEGVSGVFKDPVQGAARGGVKGFLKGMAKGVVGLAAKPVTGVLDAASSVSGGLSAALDGRSREVRVRPPRLICENCSFRAFTHEDAFVAELLDTHATTPEERWYQDHRVVTEPARWPMLVLITRSVVFAFELKSSQPRLHVGKKAAARLKWRLPLTAVFTSVQGTKVRFDHVGHTRAVGCVSEEQAVDLQRCVEQCSVSAAR